MGYSEYSQWVGPLSIAPYFLFNAHFIYTHNGLLTKYIQNPHALSSKYKVWCYLAAVHGSYFSIKISVEFISKSTPVVIMTFIFCESLLLFQLYVAQR
jgi:hypothetical protein